MKLEKQNITLSLPKKLIVRIKHIAIDKNTSVSGLLTKTLSDIVEKEDRYGKAMHRNLIISRKGYELGTEGKITWRRDDVHER